MVRIWLLKHGTTLIEGDEPPPYGMMRFEDCVNKLGLREEDFLIGLGKPLRIGRRPHLLLLLPRTGGHLGHVPVVRTAHPRGRNETGVWWRHLDEYDRPRRQCMAVVDATGGRERSRVA